MSRVEVYGVPHSPWVQAVLLGLHEAGIDHTLQSLPPFDTLREAGVMMPAARINGAPWQLESAAILRSLGFESITDEQMNLVRRAWQGVLHRADSAALFWGGFSLAGDRHPARLHRLASNFLRSFITLYFFLLIRTVVLFTRPKDPEDFASQFVPFDDMLAASDAPYLNGQAPNSLDLLLFGIIQCHCSVYVPPLTTLQTDGRLRHLRAWIGRMQTRFKDYGHLYSGTYFAPFSSPPVWASALDRAAFWLGAVFMIALFPVTVPLVAFLAMRNRRS